MDKCSNPGSQLKRAQIGRREGLSKNFKRKSLLTLIIVPYPPGGDKGKKGRLDKPFSLGLHERTDFFKDLPSFSGRPGARILFKRPSDRLFRELHLSGKREKELRPDFAVHHNGPRREDPGHVQTSERLQGGQHEGVHHRLSRGRASAQDRENTQKTYDGNPSHSSHRSFLHCPFPWAHHITPVFPSSTRSRERPHVSHHGSWRSFLESCRLLYGSVVVVVEVEVVTLVVVVVTAARLVTVFVP